MFWKFCKSLEVFACITNAADSEYCEMKHVKHIIWNFFLSIRVILRSFYEKKPEPYLASFQRIYKAS